MHLKSLHIKNFRALEDFEVSKLGRVNLIVGKNNSGKSSVLEALRIYAGNAHPLLLEEIARSHGEKWRFEEGDFESYEYLPFEAFFTGRRVPEFEERVVDIGDGTAFNSVKIEIGFFVEERTVESTELGEQVTRLRLRKVSRSEAVTGDSADEPYIGRAVFVQTGQDKPVAVRFGSQAAARNLVNPQKSKPCYLIPTQFLSLDELADDWDKIGLTEAHETLKEALHAISPDFESILFVKNGVSKGTLAQTFSRNAIVKLKAIDDPVPLNSMGDGMVRMFQLVVKLYRAKGGFLLIDEFENGLHYSIQEEIWGLIFDLAEKLDIQIFATTHSWDCVASFSRVATLKTSSEGVLFRVGRSIRTSDKGKVIATVFDENKLATITQSDVEVR